MGEIDDMRKIIEVSIVADSRHGEKIRALDALYHLSARAEAAEQRAEAAEAEVARLRAEVAQACADALVLLAECHSADVADGGDFFGSAGMLAQAGMTRAEAAHVRMLPLSDDDPAVLLAIVRRVLGGAR